MCGWKEKTEKPQKYKKAPAGTRTSALLYEIFMAQRQISGPPWHTAFRKVSCTTAAWDYRLEIAEGTWKRRWHLCSKEDKGFLFLCDTNISTAPRPELLSRIFIKHHNPKHTAYHLVNTFLARLISRPWTWRRYVSPKRPLTFNGPHGAVPEGGTLHNHRCETSNPTEENRFSQEINMSTLKQNIHSSTGKYLEYVNFMQAGSCAGGDLVHTSQGNAVYSCN
jgi:hypothetical protein